MRRFNYLIAELTQALRDFSPCVCDVAIEDANARITALHTNVIDIRLTLEAVANALQQQVDRLTAIQGGGAEQWQRVVHEYTPPNSPIERPAHRSRNRRRRRRRQIHS